MDRVDQIRDCNDLYLRIIDYKSSEKDLSLVDVYYGLSLQMLTYLDVVLTHSEKGLARKLTQQVFCTSMCITQSLITSVRRAAGEGTIEGIPNERVAA